jgi:colicin import membrane protein
MKQTQKKIGNTQTSTPEQRDERRALGYALAIHGALILFMLFGFIASPSNPSPVQVELWADGTTPTAAEPDTEPETVEEASARAAA